MLQLYDLNKTKIQGLKQYKDLNIESTLSSGDKVLSFSYPQNLSENIKEEGYIRTKTDEFVIKAIQDKGEWKDITATLNIEALEGQPWEHFDTTEKTIDECLTLAVAGTGWTILVNGVTKKRTVRKTNCSTWDIIQQAKKTYRVEMQFDTINRIVKVAEKLGSDKGVYFMDSLNLKSLDIQSNSYDFYTRIIAIGKDDLKVEVENYQYSSKKKTLIWKDERYTILESLKEDATAKLNDISKPYRAYSADVIDLASIANKYNILSYGLGDTITLISKDKRIKERQRIFKITEYPKEPEKNTCEIANTLLRFEDIQKEQQDTTDTVNNITTDNGTVDGSAINSIKTEQISDFEVSVGKITNLTAINIRVDNLYAKKADIDSLNAVEIRVGNLIGTKANITQLDAEVARINQAFIKTATIENLNATNGKITLLETKVGSIDTILSKEVFAELISAGKIVAGSSIIAESAIGSAQINSLDLNKLNAGSIDTSKIQLVGPNGRLKLVGNKLQIFDTINGQQFERVMLGVDGSNNSTIVLRGADGKTVLLNQDGLTKPGFTDGYNKLEDNSLPGTKLDINSVMRGMNEKGTETIKGTKVSIGDRTLDVELSTQKNLIDGANKELSTQKATINAMDQAIKLKVDNQTFTQYKNTTDDNINTVSTNLNKATSSIEVLQKEIALKVEQTEIDKSIKELEIGVRNLLRKSKLDYVPNPSSTSGTGTISEVVQDDLHGMVLHINRQYVSDERLYVPKESLNVGDQITLSIMVKSKIPCTFSCQLWNTTTISSMVYVTSTPEWQWLSYTKTIVGDPNSKDSRLYIYFTPDNEYWIKCIKIEKGNKATDWTPAPEDIDQAINTVDTKINTKVGEINISLDGITSRVGKTESASTVIDGKITALSTRVTNAETKLTDSSIISTVRNSTAYKSDLNGKANQTALTTAESKIVQLADLISHKVESTDFTSYKTQTANEIGQRVSKGEFGSLFKQNADSFNFNFGPTGGTNLIKNGRFLFGLASWNTGSLKAGIYDLTSQYNRVGIENVVILSNQNKSAGFFTQNRIPVIKGTKYTLSFTYLAYPNVSLNSGAKVVFLNENYVQISETGAAIQAANSILPFVLRFQTPPGCSYVNVEIAHRGKTNDAVEADWRITNIMLNEGENPMGWIPHQTELTTTSVSISDTAGLVIKNNAISVISKSGRTAFSVDDYGYITNEWGVSTRVPPGQKITISNGTALADEKCSTLLRAFGLWHESVDDKYNLRIASKTEIWFKNLADEWQDTRCKWSYANQFRIDGGVSIRENSIDTASASRRLWLNYGGGAPGSPTSTIVGDGVGGGYGELHCGAFYAHGSKNRAVETEHFGIRALGAYEMPTPYFGDISRQVYEVIDGQCIVPLEPIFKETITSTGEYQVFFSKYGPGDIWTAEMYPTYFIVKGANIKFSWELKAIQRGYENNRLEQVQM